MNFDQPQADTFESKEKRAPDKLLEYEKWWGETYGREVTPEEDEQLIDLAKQLASEDEKFKGILAEALVREFVGGDDGLEDAKNRRWALVGALSTYGKEFGLKVD